MNNLNDVRKEVMDAIKQKGVHMRPRWHFLLLTALMAIGVALLLLTLIYIVSLGVFAMHENGTWYMGSFGMRGWFDIVRSLPLYLLLLVALFAIILETLVRRYSFGYRRPLIASLGVILLIVFLGGFVLAQTSLHKRLSHHARHGDLPPPFGMWYGRGFQPPPPPDIFRGRVISAKDGMIVAYSDEGTSTIVITPRTRLPFGADFAPGDLLIVVGDSTGTGTIQAFGIREIEPNEQD